MCERANKKSNTESLRSPIEGLAHLPGSKQQKKEKSCKAHRWTELPMLSLGCIALCCLVVYACLCMYVRIRKLDISVVVSSSTQHLAWASSVFMCHITIGIATVALRCLHLTVLLFSRMHIYM